LTTRKQRRKICAAGGLFMRSSFFTWILVPWSLIACSGGGSGNAPPPTQETPEHQALAALAFKADSPPAPPDSSNKWADSADAALFGQRLFFDPGFSGELLTGDNDGSVNALGNNGDTGKVACAGCHLPESGFSDTRTIRQQVSLGAGWGLRRAPSLLDVGQSKLIMWDGRKDALYAQPFGVIENAVEMNSSRLYAAEHVFSAHQSEYEALFGPLPPLDDTTRFPALTALETGCRQLDPETQCVVPVQRGAPGDGAEFDSMAPADQDAVTRVIVNVGKALGAYERLLACGPTRFDRWMQGDASALDDSEQRGAALFVGKAKCVGCHSGPFMSDEQFHNVGLKPATVATVFIDAGDDGAASGFQKLANDPLNVQGAYADGNDGRDPTGPGVNGGFRTPKLRCASARPSFMHTAQLRTLDDVVAFFNEGGNSGGYPGTNELTPLNLTSDESSDLVAFLKSLQGDGPPADLLVSLDGAGM
jgi:cytochrome c peroxidase